jgi:hypothetical protein
MIHKGDRVRVVDLSDWIPETDHPDFFLGKEGTVIWEGSFLETDIKDMVGNNTLFLEEELRKI